MPPDAFHRQTFGVLNWRDFQKVGHRQKFLARQRDGDTRKQRAALADAQTFLRQPLLAKRQLRRHVRRFFDIQALDNVFFFRRHQNFERRVKTVRQDENAIAARPAARAND